MDADETAAVVEGAAPIIKKPKVSVCVIAYNQERYIEQCLQSIVDQETNFDFEIIVADDCSTDNTQSIIKEFAKIYSNIIPVLHQENIGITLNYRSAHDMASGEYIAHCDGDDMWLPGKLAYQADLLDKNPDASQCWCFAHLVDDLEIRVGIFPSRLGHLLYPTTVTARDIAMSYALVGQHSSQMYRRRYKFNFDTSKPTLDFWIAFNMALNGPAIYSKKILSCYRITSTDSVTRMRDNRRVTVDSLAIHLGDIIKTHPEFSSTAKANMIARRLLSRIRGHDLEEISKEIAGSHLVSVNWIAFVKSISYFLMQKIF